MLLQKFRVDPYHERLLVVAAIEHPDAAALRAQQMAEGEADSGDGRDIHPLDLLRMLPVMLRLTEPKPSPVSYDDWEYPKIPICKICGDHNVIFDDNDRDSILMFCSDSEVCNIVALHIDPRHPVASPIIDKLPYRHGSKPQIGARGLDHYILTGRFNPHSFGLGDPN